MSVFFWRFGMSVEVKTRFFDRLVKVESKLRSIVSLNVFGTQREDMASFDQKVGGTFGAVIGICHCESRAFFGINAGQNVALHTINKSHHSVNFQDSVSFGPPLL